MTKELFSAQKKQASYGALLSIILILAIVIVGAFYVAGQRVKQNAASVVLPTIGADDTASTTATTTPATY
jgi:hypothetical protein